MELKYGMPKHVECLLWCWTNEKVDGIIRLRSKVAEALSDAPAVLLEGKVDDGSLLAMTTEECASAGSAEGELMEDGGLSNLGFGAHERDPADDEHSVYLPFDGLIRSGEHFSKRCEPRFRCAVAVTVAREVVAGDGNAPHDLIEAAIGLGFLAACGSGHLLDDEVSPQAVEFGVVFVAHPDASSRSEVWGSMASSRGSEALVMRRLMRST